MGGRELVWEIFGGGVGFVTGIVGVKVLWSGFGSVFGLSYRVFSFECFFCRCFASFCKCGESRVEEEAVLGCIGS